jgi:transposase
MSRVHYFAADVSKRELVIAAYPGAGDVVPVVNTTAGITAWLETLAAGSVIAMEATGTYHRRLAGLAHVRGFVVYVVNPRDVYYYARAMGARGKTDASDARLLARYVAHEQAHLHRYVPPTPRSEQLTILLERRALLVRTRQALKQSLADLAALDAEKRRALEALDLLVKAIDRQLTQLNDGDPPTAQLVTRLKTISGVGPLVATLLAALFQRFAFRHADALIAYVGLDPRPDQSGQRQGRRRLSKRGPPEWRRLLVAAAMSAARTNAWRDYVARQRAKALPATAVHVILARKILRVALALYKNSQQFVAPQVQIA